MNDQAVVLFCFIFIICLFSLNDIRVSNKHLKNFDIVTLEPTLKMSSKNISPVLAEASHLEFALNLEIDIDEIEKFLCLKNIFEILEKLKITKYTYWHWDGIDPAKYKFKSIFHHASRTIFMANNLLNSITFDKFKVVKMSLLNDIYEAFREDNDFDFSYEQKIELELEAHGFRVHSLLNEYEEGISVEYHLVKDIRLMELVIQTVKFEQSHKINFQELIDNFKSKIHHDIIKSFVATILIGRPSFDLKDFSSAADKITIQ